MANQPAPRPTPDWAADFPKLREATAMLTALYRHEPLPGHVNRALDNGVTKEELVEVITHATFYSGWPTGVQGAVIARKVFEARGLAVHA
jgi:alkylhydroperoxidase/carboxymuconolactone decarboxylase family protein YurZ